jgi:hypothetical protein
MSNPNAEDSWGGIADSFYVEPREKPHPSPFLSNYIRSKDTAAEPEPVPPHVREADHLYNDPFKVFSDYNFRPKLIPLAYAYGGRRSTIKEESADDTSDVTSSSPSDGNAFSSSQGKSPSAYLQHRDSPTAATDPNGFGDTRSNFFSGLMHLNRKRDSDTRANTDSPKDATPTNLPRKVSTSEPMTPKERKTSTKRGIQRSRSKGERPVVHMNAMDNTEETVEENKNCLAYRAAHAIENKSNDDIEKISTELLNGEDIYEHSPVIVSCIFSHINV